MVLSNILIKQYHENGKVVFCGSCNLCNIKHLPVSHLDMLGFLQNIYLPDLTSGKQFYFP